MCNVSRYFALLCLLFSLGACVTSEEQKQKEKQHHSITPFLMEPLQQYVCSAKIYISDATKAFQLSGKAHGESYDIELGGALEPLVNAMFWIESSALTGDRPQVQVNLGFANGSFSRLVNSGAMEVGVSLQFQIFKPTGQSYSDAVTGLSSVESVDRAAGDALEQALVSLGNNLVSTGVCHLAQ